MVIQNRCHVCVEFLPETGLSSFSFGLANNDMHVHSFTEYKGGW